MDGTIVDTEPFWMAAETELVTAHGGSWTHEQAMTLVGQGLGYSASVLQAAGVELSSEAIIDHLTELVLARVQKDGLPWRPGARELLLELSDAGIPTALVTMSIRKMASIINDTIDFRAFHYVVAGDDVELPKPNPAAYLRAAELLGVDPRDCVAIEDSAPGIAAAVASGAATIGVPLHVKLPENGRFTVWPSLAGHTLADLAEVLADARTASSGTLA
jgi:HAD superfamily hydrolase (TIGR01509 family)